MTEDEIKAGIRERQRWARKYDPEWTSGGSFKASMGARWVDGYASACADILRWIEANQNEQSESRIERGE